MSYQSMEEVYERCEKGRHFILESHPAWRCIERGVTEEDSWERMKGMWQAMQEFDALIRVNVQKQAGRKRRRSDGSLPEQKRRCAELYGEGDGKMR